MTYHFVPLETSYCVQGQATDRPGPASVRSAMRVPLLMEEYASPIGEGHGSEAAISGDNAIAAWGI